MTGLDQYILELEIELDTTATRIRLASQYCEECGTRLIDGKCPYGCATSGNEHASNVDDMRHPDW